MELRQILSIVWKWAWLAVLAVFIAATTSYFASKAMTPLYRTTTTLMIGAAIQNPDPNSVQIYTSQQLAYTYVQLASRENVLSGTIKALGLKMNWNALAGQVSANNIPNTQLLTITVVDVDPYRAKVLADEVANQLILQGPAASGDTNPDQTVFAQNLLKDLKEKIETGQQDMVKLNQDLDAANSAREIQDLQTQIAVLGNKVNNWQNTYAALLLSVKGGGSNSLSVVESARIPSAPFSPNTRQNMLAAAAIGLALAVLGVVLIEYFDDTIKLPDDFTTATGLPALAAIARIEGDDYPDKLLAQKQPLSPIVESYRILRTNLQFSSIDKPLHTLILTSPGPAEGKSVTIANLAVVLAQSGRKVIVVDADLRRPVQHKIFGVSNRLGLTDALLHAVSPSMKSEKSMQREATLNQAVMPYPSSLQKMETNPTVASSSDHVKALLDTIKAQVVPTSYLKPDEKAFETVQPITEFLKATGVENLRLLSTGSLPVNPSELMGSERMAILLELLKAEADLILVDTPPMLMVADAAILGSRMDGAIMVVDSGKTRVSEARRAVAELRKGQINLVGGVVNRLSRRSGGYYYYYHRYYDADGNRSESRKKKRYTRFINKVLAFLPLRSNHHEK
jgi:Mrp family chromosome partitioning ATPase/capsular polysaccharide biosynthesis protein